jgi:hypothetical protein
LKTGDATALIGNELSIRYGLRTLATLVFVLSAFAGGLFGFTAMLPYIAVLGLCAASPIIQLPGSTSLLPWHWIKPEHQAAAA